MLLSKMLWNFLARSTLKSRKGRGKNERGMNERNEKEREKEREERERDGEGKCGYVINLGYICEFHFRSTSSPKLKFMNTLLGFFTYK